MRMWILLCLALLCLAVEVLAQAAPDAFVRQRREMAHHQRRIIFNNDGNEIIYYPEKLPLTVESVLEQRTSPLLGSQVDAIFYCPISSGFSYFTHDTKVGTVLEHSIYGKRNIARELINMGTDALKMIVDFGRAHDIEVFFSMRMNDTHDGAHSPDKPYPLFPPLKAEHPEWLFGTPQNRPKYGQWTSVDYTRPEVRELAYRFFEEVCRNYDVDGVEMDFFRHMAYFKSVGFGGQASDAEREMMTELVRRVRVMADAEGRKRGRPILIAVRVPDSVEYSRAVGLDLERWLAEGLVDLLVGGGYFQLNPWETLVALGHKYDVPVYPSLDESRVRGDGPPYRRNAIESYRGRAARVWQSGADGVYLFNFFNAKSPMLREIGDPQALAKLDQNYFVTVRNYSPEMYVKGGKAFLNLPLLSPDNPVSLSPGKAQTVPVMLGERPGEGAQVTLCLLSPSSLPLQVEMNEKALGEAKRAGQWWEYAVPGEVVKAGENQVKIVLPDADGRADGWDVAWEGTAKPGLPWTGDRPGAKTAAEIKDGAMLLADRGTEPGTYMYYNYAWNASPERETVAELEAKVVSGLSHVIISNGSAIERLCLYPDRVTLYSTPVSYAMNTTDDFHTYRVVLQGKDIQVFVDGKLALDGRGKFVAEVPGGRNSLQFGAANSPEMGEALWRAVRLRAGAASLFDLVVKFDYSEAKE